METKFTPGPWALAPGAVIVGADGRRVCSLSVRLDGADVADARLIAAAPELFEALKVLTDFVSVLPADMERHKAYVAALAALAKARGDQS